MDVRSLGERGSNYTNSSVRNKNRKNALKSKSNKGSSMSSGGNGIIAAGLIAGAGVGVLAGMLLAPKTGKDLRKQVTDSANKLGSQATDLYNTGMEKVNSWTGKDKKDIGSTTGATSRTDKTPNANITPGRDLNNDPATSITM